MDTSELSGKIHPVDLRQEMQRSYLDYAMSVIVGRALPDVRDGLKPVHRRVLYAMYKGGYRPDKAYSKCARVVGDVMGQFHPHGDKAIYDALVRLVQPWSLRYPLALGQGNFGSPGNDGAAAPRYTETKMAPLALEMVREIDEQTVDFIPNYDGESQEPLVLPSRFPNLLVNGSVGIAVGMATNIPPHNLKEVSEAALWYLENPQASETELLEAMIERILGPDFPTGAQILGRRGIDETYRTGRGSIIMRAVVEVEEIQGRICLVVTELPYQVNPDNLALKIAALVKEGRLSGVADIRDETSGRTGQRLVIVLKRDAIARVVLNNLFKHTQLQETFGANMLAIVDGVPKTLNLAGFIEHWVAHQIEVVVRRTTFRLKKAEERAHILRGYLRALDQLDRVIALIRASVSAEAARLGLIELLNIDQLQARAILELQLRNLAALERQKIIDEAEQIEAKIREYGEILSNQARQCELVAEELRATVAKHADKRRTKVLLDLDSDLSMEDLIPEESVVVSLTRGGYIKRTLVDQFRSQHRGGRGVKGAQLRADDVVSHFLTTTTHHWLFFLTNFGRVYRLKVYDLPETGRDAKGQHVANLLLLQPGESVAEMLPIKEYSADQDLVIATKHGYVKRTCLAEYDISRQVGVIGVRLREGDEVVSVMLTQTGQHIILVSRKGKCLRFSVDDETLRQVSRDTFGVRGMRFRDDDELLAAVSIANDRESVFIVTETGYAKKTPVTGYRTQARKGVGVRVARLDEGRGRVADALIVRDEDEVLVILKSGRVMRSKVSEIVARGRDTKGVLFVRLDPKDKVLALTKVCEWESEAGKTPAPDELE